MRLSSKFKLLSLVTLVTMGSAGHAMAADPTPPTPVTVNGGTVHFTGEIVNAACAVDNDSTDQIVKLGQLTATSLKKKGAMSSIVPFSIKLTDCDLSGTPAKGNNPAVKGYSTVAVTFLGTQTGSDGTAISVTGNPDGASGSKDIAQNVGIEILQNGTPLKIDGSAASSAQTIHAGDNTLNFGAAYVAIADAVTAGTANADATFKLTYE
ncbi:fimbrial protein [Rahnella sp. AN3-3W3]|uniref:fimbrial protein n=1 Tax=Rahnella sp. AN3-3W3 TaxID=1610578 RepID=UPI0013006107|nr:fimbrial protein [Rahnella sp. AN3-3W3]